MYTSQRQEDLKLVKKMHLKSNFYHVVMHEKQCNEPLIQAYTVLIYRSPCMNLCEKCHFWST